MTQDRQDWHDVLADKDMEVTAVCIGKVENLPGAGLGDRDLRTAFRKRKVDGFVKVSKLGMIGDEIGDPNHHGGVEQAVYVFCGDDYAWWKKELDRNLPPGSFGENMIISNLGTEEVMLGDNINFPDLVLEASAPRIPCGKLAAFMNDKNFGVKFIKSRRCGFYCRVLEVGMVEAGQKATIEREASSKIHISDMLKKG